MTIFDICFSFFFAADQDLAPAIFNLAYYYQFGIGVEKSLENAIKYYQFAIEKQYNEQEAKNYLEQCKKEMI